MITIFTPAYNRASTLDRLYKSILNQDSTDLEWLIVDDGSTDNTKETVEKYILENKINIRYIYQENGGKSSAVNHGLKEAKGDLFTCVDSDDILADNVLEMIFSDYKKIKDDDSVAGIGQLTSYITNNEIIGTKFPEDNMICTYNEAYEKYKVTGDKNFVFKTSIIKQYPFPIFEGEKFVPEALVYNRISLKYKLLLRNEVVVKVEYLDDGYTASYFNLVKKNPKGNALYFKEKYNLNRSIYNIYVYILFCLFARYKFNKIIKEHSNRFIVTLMLIPVYFIYLIRR